MALINAGYNTRTLLPLYPYAFARMVGAYTANIDLVLF